MRGDTFDGRNFIKATMSGTPEAKQRRPIDMDVDAKIGAVAGFKGEVLRNLDLHLTRRGGAIRNLAATARGQRVKPPSAAFRSNADLPAGSGRVCRPRRGACR